MSTPTPQRYGMPFASGAAPNLSMSGSTTPIRPTSLAASTRLATPITPRSYAPQTASTPSTPQSMTSLAPSPAQNNKRPRQPIDNPNKRARTKRRVTDTVQTVRAMPMEESNMYLRLVEFEREIDFAINRRRRAILSAIQKPQQTNTRRRTLRVWVYNLHHNQPVRDPELRAQMAKGRKEKMKLDEDAMLIDQPTTGIPDVCIQGLNDPVIGVAPGGEDDEPASWTLRVQGKLLPDPSDEPLRGTRAHPDTKFSQCIDRAVVELDRVMYTDFNVIEWRAQPHDDSLEDKCVDGIELKRIGSAECRIKVFLYPAANKNHFRVLPPLSSLLGVERATRPQLLTMLWTYIQAHDLLDLRGGGETVVNNSELSHVFSTPRMDLSSLANRISPFMSPLGPIELSHTIKLNGDVEDNEACYDITLEVDDGRALASNALPTLNTHQVATWNSEIDKNMRRLQEHKDKRDFMMGFSYAPLDFMTSLITSQAKEIMVRTNNELRGVEEKLYHQTFYQPFIHEAVLKHLIDQLGSSAKKGDRSQPSAQSHFVERLHYRAP